MTAAITFLLVGCGGGGDQGNASTTTKATREPWGFEDARYSGSGRRVVVFGDSITVRSAARIRAALRGDAVKMTAWLGEGWSGGPLTNETHSPPLLAERARRWSGDDPDVAIFELGTNDAWDPELTVPAALSAMREMFARFPRACLVAVHVSESATAPGYRPREAAVINAAIRRQVDVVVNWLGPGRTVPDTVHPNAAGQQALATAMADGVERCAARD